jgi:hypothetical protein
MRCTGFCLKLKKIDCVSLEKSCPRPEDVMVAILARPGAEAELWEQNTPR